MKKLRILAIAAVLLLLPAAAQAASPNPEPAGSTEAFVLHGSHRYRLVVQLKNRRALAIGVVREAAEDGHGQGKSTTTYELVSRQSKDSDDIDTRIGSLGQIDVHFVPGRTERVNGPPRCEGAKTLAERGHFVGTIDFRGERGYTRVHVHRVVGYVVKVPRRTCAAPKVKPQPRSAGARSAPFAAAFADNGAAGPDLNIIGLSIHRVRDRVRVSSMRSLPTAGQSGGLAFGVFVAAAERHLGPVREWGLALQSSFKHPLGFRFPKPHEPAAEVMYSPPAPFSGSGIFARVPGAEPRWTGDLAIEFPGFGRLALTGRGTRAALCTGSRCLDPGASATP
jgi:hypothetical protein